METTGTSPEEVGGSASGAPETATPGWLSLVQPAVQVAVIIAALVALVMWLPDTLDSWDNELESDFPNFNGAALLVREGLGGQLYAERPDFGDRELREYCDIAQPGASAGGGGPHFACRALLGNFRSPPSLIVAYLPISFLPGDTPYHVSFALCAMGALALAALPLRHLQSRLSQAAFFLGVLSLPILQLSVRLSQPSVLYALAAYGGFMLNARGQPALAGAAFAVLSFKPQFLILPLAFLCYTRAWATAAWTAGVSGALLITGAALVGPEAVGNYVDLNLELLERGPVALQQAWMYNWEGFLRVLTGGPQQLIARLLGLATLVVLVSLWVRRPDIAPAASIAASVLAMPYALFYDWTLLAAAAGLAVAALAVPQERAFAGGLMVMVWAAIWATQPSLPLFGTGGTTLPDGTIYWSTLSLALALILALASYAPGVARTFNASATLRR
ncbi:MAG: DUF2029 domain-containing protein [Dehalococcoidia bacterium]|nr:DUF2029 domain-containing protein [Dehalococcoidia bacterium]